VILAPSFPAWLPTAIADEARRILECTEDPALVIRLATDKRMKRVWAELSKLKFERPQLEELVLSERGPLQDHLTDQEAALTLIFWYAYAFARAQIAIITISELDTLLASCEDMAKQLRKSAADLRALPSKLSGSERFEIEDVEHWDAGYHAGNIEEAAKFYEGAVAKIIQLKAFEGLDPRVVDRPGRYRTERSYVRHLTAQISKPLLGTLATIASVALDRPVTKDQVIEWTRGVKGP
jgi:hypothetical protein